MVRSGKRLYDKKEKGGLYKRIWYYRLIDGLAKLSQSRRKHNSRQQFGEESAFFNRKVKLRCEP
jgi:hypothetical protein